MKIKCAHTKIMDLDLLVPNPRNPNTHSDNQLKYYAKIIKHQGWRKAVTVSNQSGFVVTGHGSIMAARLNKWTEAPVDYQDFDNEADEYAHMVADNMLAELADLDKSMVNEDALKLGDFDLDLLGIPDFEPVAIEHLDPQCDEDEVPEPKESIAKLGDIWQLGRHRLMCGDSLDVNYQDKLCEKSQIHLMFTDPPYGINVVNVGATAKMGFVGAQKAPSQRARARAYKPIIGDDKDFDPASLFTVNCATRILWGANCYASKLPDNPQWLVWDKKTQDGGLDHNNFSDCELAWTDAPAKAVKVYRHVWAGMLRHGARKEEMKERVHPTQKPVGLCEQIINDFSKQDESVIDLFGGSGSTLIACEKTNRKCFMMELDPHYVDVIIARWEKYTGKVATRRTTD